MTLFPSVKVNVTQPTGEQSLPLAQQIISCKLVQI